MKTILRQAAGSLLVVGLESTELTGLERAWLKLVRPAGIILFRRNIVDAAQTRSLLADSSALCAAHAFRCVDLEGGTVDRLRDALAAMPSPQAVAAAARQPGRGGQSRAGLIREKGELVGRGVKAFGFNTTLAPVLDLALPDSSTRADSWPGSARRAWWVAESIFRAWAEAGWTRTSKLRPSGAAFAHCGARTWRSIESCAASCPW